MKKNKRTVHITAAQFPDDHRSEYQIATTETKKHQHTKVVLRYGKSDTWVDNIKGTTASSITDTEDGVVVKFEGKQLELDYSELSQLHAMLLYFHDDKLFPQTGLGFSFLKKQR